MENVIKKLFDNMINIICRGIEKEYFDIVMIEYNRILHNRYSDIDVRLNVKDYNKLYDVLIKLEFTEWSNMVIPTKKSLLIKDIVLEQIIDISNLAFKAAENRINRGIIIDKKNADVLISKMELLKEQVHDNNKVMAQWYISEGTVDLYCASNQSSKMSLRFSDVKKIK